MRAIERDYGVDYWITWRLPYRLSQIKDIGCECFARLVAAYQAECERQERKNAHELRIAQSIAASVVVEEGKAVVAHAPSSPAVQQTVRETVSPTERRTVNPGTKPDVEGVE